MAHRDLVSGEVTDVRPWEAMFNPATPPQTVHMIVAAFMVTGFGIASVYAVALLRGRRDRYHRLGFAIPFTVAALLSPVQVVVGDWAAHFVGEYQPTKLAAMEGLARTEAGAPLSLGGVYVDGELRYAVEVPNALSLLAKWDPDAVIMGLDQVPDDRSASSKSARRQPGSLRRAADAGPFSDRLPMFHPLAPGRMALWQVDWAGT
ncbi:cytochrome ubiquinol oxidase subunit I [Micromonospora coriariae]|uniref:cytochrome ubiquinol oxidase subunit I n=1 Tax=Micromonospora coriariae TaxID=285665 RepID=UPI001E43178F|nr:cytochrome ubiquinol oxidase subunit I [Micromonospora coriariae]